jgi:hypothetical protein
MGHDGERIPVYVLGGYQPPSTYVVTTADPWRPKDER